MRFFYRILECGFAALWAVVVFSLYTAVLLVAPILLLVTSCQAQDQDTRWALREFRRCEHRAWDGSCTYYSRGHYFYSPTYHTYRRTHPRNQVYHLPETRVYGYERRRDRDDDREYAGGIDCKSYAVRIAGDDKLDENRAEVSAQDRWSIEVETSHGGTMHSDIRFAKNIKTKCVRKVPTSASEKGQAMLGVRHYVCAISAVPCAAPAIRQDEDSRAKRKSERVEEDRTPPPPRRDR